MTENPVTAEFNAASGRFQAEFARYNADMLLAALRDAARDIADSGAALSLEVRPRLEGADRSQSGRVFANAVLTVEGFPTAWVLSTDRDYEGGKWVNKTSLAGFMGDNEIARFTAMCNGYEPTGEWRPPELVGKASLKDALIAVIAQARAEHDVLGGYNVGEQPASLVKPYVAGLKPKLPEKP